MASASATDKKSGFDNLPIAVQMLLGILLLLAIAAIGFGVFFAIDVLLLDFDPIGKIAGLIAGLFTKGASVFRLYLFLHKKAFQFCLKRFFVFRIFFCAEFFKATRLRGKIIKNYFSMILYIGDSPG